VAHAATLYAAAGLRSGDGVILVMTRGHAAAIDYRLSAEGFSTAYLRHTGQLTYAIAENLLPRFMRNGMPDGDRFYRILGEMIERSRKHASVRGNVRVFGEMVSLLLPISQAATERLEALWDELIQRHSISLLCTYCLGEGASRDLPERLLQAHSHNLAREAEAGH
jgi:hypothetical protein